MIEQDRINAMISYFFLGPLFLLAKKNTPLTNPYVRGHARQSSIIIGMTFIVLVVYIFVRPYIQISFLGIDLRSIVLALIMASCSIFLIRWAYKAYMGNTGEVSALSLPGSMMDMGSVSGVYSVEKEEEKVRILASLLPWIGIYISQRYQHPLMERGRIIGSFFTFIIILSFVLWGYNNFMTFILTIIYILLFVVEWVYLFVFWRFISWNILEYIPSYVEIESHIIATIHASFDFIGVVFGKEKKGSYAEYFAQSFQKEQSSEVPVPYFMPVELIALPVWNIFTLPSLFISKYRAYRSLVVQWLIITLLLGYAFYIRGIWGTAIGLLLLFPIMHIVSFSRIDSHTRAPIIGLWVNLKERFMTVKSHITGLQETTDTVGFTYTVGVNELDNKKS